MPIRFLKHSDSWCQKCNAPECHPTEPGKVIIRGLKVYDDQGAWSQCLNCAGYYKYRDGKIIYNDASGNPKLGWFCEPN